MAMFTLIGKPVTPAVVVFLVFGTLSSSSCSTEKTDATDSGTVLEIPPDLTPEKAHTLIQQQVHNPDFIILDVRTPEEFQVEHLENAMNLDYRSSSFEEEIQKLDRDKTYLIYCRSGRRSAAAQNVMGEKGFSSTFNMLDGIKGWKKAGFEVVQPQ